MPSLQLVLDDGLEVVHAGHVSDEFTSTSLKRLRCVRPLVDGEGDGEAQGAEVAVAAGHYLEQLR